MTKSNFVRFADQIQDARDAERFYGGALARILRVILVAGIVLSPLVWRAYGAAPAAGFLLGASISYLNLQWLARGVEGLGSRIVSAVEEGDPTTRTSSTREKGTVILLRFLLRYFLIGLAGYVTFVGWPTAFRGLLGGLCLAVAAMMCEAAVEAYGAIRHGF
ncbi:MAG: hypothetical protein JOY93_04340 [Acidobacteriales bacterium]|nr:hypothetical protein [Terriglobales bacterium]